MDERTKAIISAIVILIVNVAAMFGISLDMNIWVDGLCAIVALAADARGVWKNHNFTSEAAAAQAYLDNLKAERGQHGNA